MSFNGFRLFGNSNGELEHVSEVMGLFGFDLRRIVSPENFREVDSLSLNDVEPLIWGKVWTFGRQENFADDECGIRRPIVKQVEDLAELGLKLSSFDDTGTSPGELILINRGTFSLGWSFVIIVRGRN